VNREVQALFLREADGEVPSVDSPIKCYGRMKWQSDRDYGKRNQAERAIGRYKKILGNRLHSREFERQHQEVIIG
jgi:hypothetical protein